MVCSAHVCITGYDDYDNHVRIGNGSMLGIGTAFECAVGQSMLKNIVEYTF
jgi:hypothetical protein